MLKIICLNLLFYPALFTSLISAEMQKQKLTFREVRINLKRPDTGILRLSAGVNSLLFIHRHILVADKLERVVVPPSFAAVQREDGC